MNGWPIFTFGDDLQELELQDSESFEAVNGLLISELNGPMVMSFELETSTAVATEDMCISAACTVFWDLDPVSFASH